MCVLFWALWQCKEWIRQSFPLSEMMLSSSWPIYPHVQTHTCGHYCTHTHIHTQSSSLSKFFTQSFLQFWKGWQTLNMWSNVSTHTHTHCIYLNKMTTAQKNTTLSWFRLTAGDCRVHKESLKGAWGVHSSRQTNTNHTRTVHTQEWKF